MKQINNQNSPSLDRATDWAMGCSCINLRLCLFIHLIEMKINIYKLKRRAVKGSNIRFIVRFLSDEVKANIAKLFIITLERCIVWIH